MFPPLEIEARPRARRNEPSRSRRRTVASGGYSAALSDGVASGAFRAARSRV